MKVNVLSRLKIKAFDPASIDEKINKAQEEGNDLLVKRLMKLKEHFAKKVK